MGLQEKRAIKNYQENIYPNLVKEINTIAGYDIEFEVKWDTLALEDQSHLYEEGFTKVYFNPIIDALKEITTDDLGKEALKETLNKIVIKNEGNFYSASSYSYSFEKPSLTIDFQPTSNIDDVSERTKFLANLLMKQM